VIVLGLLLAQSFRTSNPPALRILGLVLAAVLALYAVRAMLVEVRVTRDNVRVRNVFSTHTVLWSEIAAVEALSSRSSALSPAYNVVLRLVDGRVIRSQALRRSSADARTIAAELADHFIV
jgi:hypothetical protein